MHQCSSLHSKQSMFHFAVEYDVVDTFKCFKVRYLGISTDGC